MIDSTDSRIFDELEKALESQRVVIRARLTTYDSHPEGQNPPYGLSIVVCNYQYLKDYQERGFMHDRFLEGNYLGIFSYFAKYSGEQLDRDELSVGAEATLSAQALGVSLQYLITIEQWEMIYPNFLSSDQVIIITPAGIQNSLSMFVREHLIRMDEMMSMHLNNPRRPAENRLWKATQARVDGLLLEHSRSLKNAQQVMNYL